MARSSLPASLVDTARSYVFLHADGLMISSCISCARACRPDDAGRPRGARAHDVAVCPHGAIPEKAAHAMGVHRTRAA